MIRRCNKSDFESIYAIINDGAQAYKGVIPEDRWTEPYMSKHELQHEIDDGVAFWGYDESGVLIGVMGIQPVQDVTLIRHAYVRSSGQRQGIGGNLLTHLRTQTATPLLIGTWADAAWAIRFYEKHGFRLLPTQVKNRVLPRYWTIPQRQIVTSVVLADVKWWELNPELNHAG
jgi:GNAT superfamily N-acetyltransferase